MPNAEAPTAEQAVRASSIGLPSDFDIRHSTLYSPHTLRADLANGPLPAARVLELGLALTEALAHLHGHGLVHRDVKPSNIIFVEGRPKLADIGLVTDTGNSRSIVGTEGYLAPEGPGTPQADLYALGKVLYEAATGLDRRRFPDLPPDLKSWPDAKGVLELNEVLLKACARDAQQRYPAAAEMRDDLALLQRGQSVKRLRALERRVAVLTKAGLVAAALLVTAAVAYLFAVTQARRTEREKHNVERLLYASDMSVAQQALEAGNLVRATTLLEAHRPKHGREDLRGFEWYYLRNLCRGDETHTFAGHEGAVEAVAISPDGKLLASCGDERTIRLWDLAVKTNLATLKGHVGPVNAIAFSPDGTRLASGGADSVVKLWDVAARAVIAQFTNPAAVTSLAFFPDGTRLAVGTAGGRVKLWDVSRGQDLHEFAVPDAASNLVAVSPDGCWLAIGGNGDRVRLWNLSTLEPVAPFHAAAGYTWGMAFSPDSKFLAATCSDGIVLWDLTQGRVLRKFRGHEREVHPVAFSPDGKLVASGSEDMTVRLWDFASGRLERVFKGHRDGIAALRFSPDGQSLVSGSADHTVKLWTLSPKEELDVLRGHTDSVNCVAFSADDRRLASAGLDGVKLWDVSSGTNLATLTGHTGNATAVVFSHDGATLFSCGLDKAIRVWNVAAREQVGEFDAGEKLACLALSPDGRTLVSGSGWWDQSTALGAVSFWDVESRQRLTNCVGKPGMIRTLSFSPDGATLAIGRMGDDSFELLEVASKRSLFFSTNLNAELAWAPDGKTLAAPSLTDTETITSFDIRTGRMLPHFQVPSGPVRFLAFSPDGKTLAVFRANAGIDLCNVVTGRKVVALQGHDGFGLHLTFSHDGQILATAGNDRTIRLWRAPK